MPVGVGVAVDAAVDDPTVGTSAAPETAGAGLAPDPFMIVVATTTAPTAANTTSRIVILLDGRRRGAPGRAAGAGPAGPAGAVVAQESGATPGTNGVTLMRTNRSPGGVPAEPGSPLPGTRSTVPSVTPGG